MKVIGIDHIVLCTKNQEGLIDFYTKTLGLEPVRVDEWRAGKAPFPSLRINANTIIDLFAVEERPETADMQHFCVLVEPTDWAAEIAAGLDIIDGPAARFGARGDGCSVYVQDPDGNVVELRYYDQT